MASDVDAATSPSLASVAGDSRWAVLSAIGLALYFALLVLPKAAPSATDVSDDDLRVYQVAGVLSFVICAGLPLLARPGLRAFVARLWGNAVGIGILSVLGISAAIAILVHGDLVAATYAVLTIAVLVACSVFWAMPRPMIVRACGVLSVLGLGFTALALWSYGVSSPGRFVGSLTPNHFANIVLTAVILGLLGPRLLRIAVVPIGIALTLPVNSRGTLIAIAVAVALRWGLRLTSERRIAALGTISCAVGLIGLLFLHPVLRSGIDSALDDVFAVDDLSRGTGSGGTGRTELWREAFDHIAERPVTGAGFRAVRQSDGRISTAHNAYIDLMQEIGVPLSAAMIVCLGLACVRRVRSARASRSDDAEQRWIAAGLVAIAINAMFEVHLLNIGFPLSVAFMLLLTASRGLTATDAATVMARVPVRSGRRRPIVASSPNILDAASGRSRGEPAFELVLQGDR